MLRGNQEAAYDAHFADYASVVAESVPPVLADVRAILGDRVRQLHDASQLLAGTATRDDVEKLCSVAGVKAIWMDLPVEPQLDVSRLSIEADRVQNGDVGGVPYTGAGVKVAVVDTGLIPDHPRLPVPSPSNQKNFACRDGRDATDGCECVNLPGHGTQVSGIIFTQPDECCQGGECPGYCGLDCFDTCDPLVGIAYNSTFVLAKMLHEVPGGGCSCNRACVFCADADYSPPTWSLILEALSWAATFSSQIGPNADVVTCSLAAPSDNLYDNTTAAHLFSRNADWVIHAGGAMISQAAGNSGSLGLRPPSGAYNIISVGSYAHNNSSSRSDDAITPTSSGGPTKDQRKKPDLCAPGQQYLSPLSGIQTTHFCWIWPTPLFLRAGGTSIATPHVAGSIALMKEARTTLVPRQIHAILLNSVYRLPGQSGWEGQPGWGQLNAYNAVLCRNRIVDGVVSGPNDAKTYELSVIPASQRVVLTMAWERSMISEANPLEDAYGNPSPASLDMFLEGRLPGGDWEVLTSDVPAAPADGNPEDNIRHVEWPQNPAGQPQYQFRVRCEHNPTTDMPFQGSQTFTIASQHAFTQTP